MRALKYKVEVTTDFVHGWKATIEEYFLPESGICFNERGGVFRNEKPRATPTEEIEVPYHLTVSLTKLVNSKSETRDELNKFFKREVDLDLLL
jgi:hypothetical protein